MKKTNCLLWGMMSLIIISLALWCTFFLNSGNRITGGFVDNMAGLKTYLLPWLIILAFAALVVVLNLKKCKR